MSQADLQFEYRLRAQGFRLIAGLDEAGRGAWAGPVVAGAVILPLDRFDLANVLHGVDDSKLLTPAQREALAPRILEIALTAGVGHADHAEIDALGIVPATKLAMLRALENIAVAPDALLIDALELPDHPAPCTAVTKGDHKSLSIAAASILAKVARDHFLDDLDELHPNYGFRLHKGYGTDLHRHTLHTFGPCAVHRLTFAPVQEVAEARRKDDDA